MLLTIVAAIFVFGLLVLVHELGHFITAKLTGMRVDEFAIGFGPKIYSTKKGETEYSIRSVPLGGFNDIAGMTEDTNEAGDRGYCRRPLLSRMIVILAGSIMNFILPIFLFFGIYFFSGVSMPNPEPVLGQVMENKSAYDAGLRSGDRIVSVAGKPINSWNEFVDSVKTSSGKMLKVVYVRNGEERTTTMIPEYDKQAKKAMVGVVSSVKMQHPGFFESISLAVQRTGYIIFAMINELIRIFSHMSGAELAGPIGVAQMAGEVAQMGIVPLLNFAAFLSLNLGIINLLPVPALDGGHFAMLCIEGLRGKPLGPKATQYFQMVGITLLVLLMLWATGSDITRIFNS